MMQTTADKLRTDYISVRARLMSPINAVTDHGIDLRRRPAPPPEPVIDPKSDLLLATLTNTPPPGLTPQRKLHCIVGAVAAFYDVPRAQILGPSRLARFVWPRHVCCYFAREILRYSTAGIGRELKYADHTTVLFAIKKIIARIQTDADYAAEIERVRYFIMYDPEVWRG